MKGAAMTGKWFYLAIAVLSGILLSLEFHLFTIVFVLVAMIRLILEKDRQIFILFCAVLFLFMLVSEQSKKTKISKYFAGEATMTQPSKNSPLSMVIA